MQNPNRHGPSAHASYGLSLLLLLLSFLWPSGLTPESNGVHHQEIYTRHSAHEQIKGEKLITRQGKKKYLMKLNTHPGFKTKTAPSSNPSKLPRPDKEHLKQTKTDPLNGATLEAPL